MLSYRHGFHAGNHADVFKHCAQWFLLNHFKKKDKPFIYVDTHSGAGWYDLTSDVSSKTSEYKMGITKVLDSPSFSEELTPFINFLQQYDAKQTYAGSPELASQVLREQDQLVFMEKHNSEIETVRFNYKHDERVSVHHRDGNEGLVAIVPPTIKRGLVLMDPSYEIKTDYQLTADTVQRSFKKWPTATYAVWYPLLAAGKDHDSKMRALFTEGTYSSVLTLRFCVEPQNTDFGMHGSAMIVVNPPWQFCQQMERVLPELAATLSAEHGSVSVEWLKTDED